MRGFCSRCDRQVGGFLRPVLWQCPKCRMVLCPDCLSGRRVGLIFKKPVCPDCSIELVEGGIRFDSSRGWLIGLRIGGRVLTLVGMSSEAF